MEGVPRLPMLRSLLKTTPEKTDFSRKIKWQIREHFNEDPNSYANEIRELESLRASACHPPQDFNGCSLLKKYYCQLLFLQNRFSFDESSAGGRNDVYFTWNDLYTGMAYSTNDIKHELACILFNIGSLHINLGAMDNRQTADGMKLSCSHFQCAAWAFQLLNDKYPQPRETDLCPDIIRFMAIVCLAQAQECILDKSIVDGRKPGIVAKVAAQIVEYYRSALKVLDQADNHADGNAVIEVAGTKTYKSWMKYADFKATFHQSVSLLYMGIHSEEMQKMGERLAYYQAAMDKLTEATKLAKKIDGQGESINDAVSFTHDVVGGKLKAAEKENEFVYHEKVPERTALAEIKGASLVKGTAFDPQDPEVSGQDIFHRLVPMEAHEASSLYSEEKAKLLRRVGGSVEEKDQELAVFLTSLQVDQLRLHSEPGGLPQELVDRCAAFSVESDVAQSLIEAMGQLSSVYTDVESSLAEAQELLNEEQQNEKLFHQGQQGNKRPPSMILKELSLEAARFSDAHAKAADSNMLLHKAINSHLGNLRTLSLPLSEIQAQLPSLQDSSKDQAATKELQRLLDKVEEMRKQRRMLYGQLREALQADDITKLATHQTDLDVLFTQELGKHQRLTSLIEQNLSAQEKILVALTEANARYADTRRSTADVQQRRSAIVSSLLSSADAYPDLLSKCQKGIEFYRKMEANITKLLQRLRSVVRVQQEEREQQLEAARTRSSPSVPDISSSSSSSDGPKLKDFLHMMKNKGSASSIVAALPGSSAAIADSNTPSSYNYPYHQPAPLSVHQNDPVHLSQPSYSAEGAGQYYYPAGNSGASFSNYPTSTPSPSSIPSSSYSPASSKVSQPAGYQQFTAASMTTSANSAPTNSHVYSQYAQPQLYSEVNPASSFSTQQPPSFSASNPSYSTYSSFNPSNGVPQQPASSVSSYPSASLTYSAPGSLAAAAYPSASYSYSTPLTTIQSVTSTASYSTPYYTNQAVPASPAHQPSATETHPQASYANYSAPLSSSQQTSYQAPMSTVGPSSGYSGPNGAQTYTTNGYGAVQPSSGYFPSGSYPAASPYQQNYGVQPGNAYGYPQSIGSSSQPVVYGYGGSTSGIVSSEGYQHGTTGTTNTPSVNHHPASFQADYNVVPSAGVGQYLQYPYYSDTAQAPTSGTNQVAAPSASGQSTQQSYYYPNGYQTNGQASPAQYSAPTLVPTSSSVPPRTPAATASSNLELLTLLDLSVPIGPSSGGMLEPQPRREAPLSNTYSTTTLTSTNTKTMMDQEHLPKSFELTTSPISSEMEFGLNNKVLSGPIEPIKAVTPPIKDPLADAESAAKLAAEVEKLDKLVDGLTRKSLNGPTPLDAKWKEVQELQERESARRSISVARCYPMKNRISDVLPYDHNRIELPTTKDDYINASMITSLSPSGNTSTPSFIATQAPLSCSLQDFWTMIWQQGVEIVVCLLSDAEISPKNNGLVYWPTEKGRDMSAGPWSVSLQSSNVRPYCYERILSLSKQGESKQRVLIHLQFTTWPGNSFPASPAQFLQLAGEVLHCWQQQRSSSHPIVVHCMAGAGRTGLLCLICTALADLASGHGLIDVIRVAANLCQQRRNMFRDREHLLFAYQALLYHAQDLLMKRGILSGTGSLQGSPIKKTHPSQDFIHSQSPTAMSNSDVVLSATGVSEAADKVENVSKTETPVKKIESPSPVAVASSVPVEAKKLAGALAILDPANFTLEGAQPQKLRVTKESFTNKNATQLGTSKDPADPLSQLDPLWSLTK